MNHLHTDIALWTPHFQVIWFFDHWKITHMILDNIKQWRNYVIQEISARGERKISEYSGGALRKNYPQVFANWKHGFIVTEEWSEEPVFVYSWPIPDKVTAILEIDTLPKFLH